MEYEGRNSIFQTFSRNTHSKLVNKRRRRARKLKTSIKSNCYFMCNIIKVYIFFEILSFNMIMFHFSFSDCKYPIKTMGFFCCTRNYFVIHCMDSIMFSFRMLTINVGNGSLKIRGQNRTWDEFQTAVAIFTWPYFFYGDVQACSISSKQCYFSFKKLININWAGFGRIKIGETCSMKNGPVSAE